MKETVSKYRFKAVFAEIRPNNFTYKGLSYLYDYLINLEDDTGVESELDVIGICCEFSEYKSVDDLCNAYSVFHDARKEAIENDEDVFKVVRDAARDKTEIVCFEPDCIIIQNF